MATRSIVFDEADGAVINQGGIASRKIVSDGASGHHLEITTDAGRTTKGSKTSHKFSKNKCTECGYVKSTTTSSSSSSDDSSSSSSSGSGNSRPSAAFAGSTDFPISDQIFYIYDPSQQTFYRFDGVVKVAHSLTLETKEDIDDDDDHASEYINNARNKPDQITFDVIMSNVYTSRDALTDKQEDRSASAMEVLAIIKRNRALVDVITNIMVYTGMLLTGIAITQDDDTTHFGWYGQLTFQEKYNSSSGSSDDDSDSSSSTKTGSSTGTARTESVWVSWVGEG